MRIVISGTVGVGKSTVSELLAEKLRKMGKKVNLIGESTQDSIYFDFYYKNPKKWAFIAQLDWIMNRFKNWLENEDLMATDKDLITIYDRHFLDDSLFAAMHVEDGNIDSESALVYKTIYQELKEKMAKAHAEPDYFFLLIAPLEEIIKRVSKRDREAESGVDLDYWKRMYKDYYEKESTLKEFKGNSKKFELVQTQDKTPEEIVEEIIKEIKL